MNMYVDERDISHTAGANHIRNKLNVPSHNMSHMTKFIIKNGMSANFTAIVTANGQQAASPFTAAIS